MWGYSCDTLLFSEWKSLSELVKKSMCSHFDSLTFKVFGLYVNLVRHFVAYSQPFNLVYR
jgi:hypothetical protein